MAKTKTDETFSLSVTGLKRLGFFIGYTSKSVIIKGSHVGQAEIRITTDVWDSNNWMNLRYGIKSGRYTEPMDYVVPLTTTPCNYGGKRYWFLCSCGRRCGVLYLQGKHFTCRLCNQLAYRSQSRNRKWRMLYKLVDYQRMLEQAFSIKRTFYRGTATKRYKKFLLSSITSQKIASLYLNTR